MPIESEILFVPTIDNSLLLRLKTPDSWMLDLASENIDTFNKTLASVPRNYAWRYMTAEAFQTISDSHLAAGNATERYRHYWHDMICQIEAFSIMTAWRLAEVARSAVWAISRDDVVCAALMSRAALETTASYAWLQSKTKPAFDQISQGNTPTILEGLEDELLKVVFASRLKDAEKFYNPTSIATIIENIAKKIPHQETIADLYSALCEVAHPNMLGRSIYITAVDKTDIAGHENRTISMNHGPATIGILRDSISALSWSTATFSKSCFVMQESIRKILNHVNRISS